MNILHAFVGLFSFTIPLFSKKQTFYFMQLILLSGGSGKRLWPLSNDSYSKQFLRLLPAPDGTKESMLQRVVRQIRESGLEADVTIATGENQVGTIRNQLGDKVSIVTEPERRDTFPAIALACLYLEKEKLCDKDETVVVMPSDPYADENYFHTIGKMVSAVEADVADLVLMGIEPTCASTKYGYVVPQDSGENVMKVDCFTEKPDSEKAKELIDGGALWNGGVFAFRLGYLSGIVRNYMQAGSFQEARERYGELPKISFDYEVAEKAASVAVVPFKGVWKDLGTWDALSEVLGCKSIGRVLTSENCSNTHVVNTLDTPCVCVGTTNLIVAISPDGILVADKQSSEHVKPLVNRINDRPMYEERRWGTYKVIDRYAAQDERTRSLTRHLCIKAGKGTSYQMHFHRDEVWTFVDGTGKLALDGEVRDVKKGDAVFIRKGQKHAVKAVTDLHFVEVQIGDNLTEEDIERFDFSW